MNSCWGRLDHVSNTVSSSSVVTAGIRLQAVSTLNRVLVLAFVSTSLCLSACVSHRVSLESPFEQLRTTTREHVYLRTAGADGQTFHAILNIDGTRQELSGTSPAEFPLDVCWMTAEVRKTGGPGSLSFRVVAPRRAVGCCGLEKPGSSCWFAYHDGKMRSRH